MPKSNQTSRTQSPESGYIADIGIECHVQLNTASKLFCGCSNDARQEDPNTTVCPVCFGLPGTLPVLNKQAVYLAMQAAVALNAEIARHAKFDRKNYFYPDLPKGYQITQYDEPVIGTGEVEVPLDDDTFTVGIVRAHMEEDAGKLVHPESVDYSLVDLNRAGTPLLEIVSGADMHTPRQARAYARELYFRMLYAGVSDVDLYHGNMRFDLNISVRPQGAEQLGTRAEIKNLNSFRNVERAAEYEIDRQTQLLDKGQSVAQETRGWDEEATYSMRQKEEAEDYRYFPEPDIPPLTLDNRVREQGLGTLPSLVTDIRAAFREAGISRTKIEALINQPRLARLQMVVLEEVDDSEKLARITNWMTSEVVRLVRQEAFDWEQFSLTADQLRQLADMTVGGELNSSAAKQVLADMLTSERAPREIAENRGLLQTSDTAEIEAIVDRVIADNPRAAQDVRGGETKAVGYLTGQVMKASGGNANPSKVQEILYQKLAE